MALELNRTYERIELEILIDVNGRFTEAEVRTASMAEVVFDSGN